MASTAQELTLAEFLALPEEKPALEYEYGRVTQKMSPQGHHAVLQGILFSLLDQYGRRERRALAFTELRTTYAGFSRVPDVAIYRWERVPRDARGRVLNAAFSEPPDIAIEIVSPGQSVNAQLSRCLEYVAAGVVLAVLVDPDDESVVVVRADRTVHAARGQTRIDLDAVLPGFELTAQQLSATLILPPP